MRAHPHPLVRMPEPPCHVISDAGEEHAVPAQDQVDGERFAVGHQRFRDGSEILRLVHLAKIAPRRRHEPGEDALRVVERQRRVLDRVRLLHGLGQFGAGDLGECLGMALDRRSIISDDGLEPIPRHAVDHAINLA